ncbi:MAG: hypothetical protein DUD39_02640 [Coriobacteriaceae bacterium]|nr:MAG: hypothetical protein DUD39_02640 [Coriobacteriaceae bacterium]
MAARGHGRIRGAKGLPRQAGGTTARCARDTAPESRQGMHSGSCPTLFPSSSFHPDAKDMLASSLAREILAADSERAKLSAELGRLPQDDKTYRCLLTILGIGPQSASALATSIDTSLSLRDSKLAAYCGLTPADHDCRSSIRSVQSAHKGNKALKNLLIFSCNSLVGTKKRFGKHYDAWHRQGHEAQQGTQGSGPQDI